MKNSLGSMGTIFYWRRDVARFAFLFFVYFVKKIGIRIEFESGINKDMYL